MKRFVHSFVLMAVMLVGISPACQFVSGKSLYEICSIDGTVEAKIDADLLAYLPAQPIEQENEHEAQPQCGFCFAQTHLKAAEIEIFAFTVTAISSHKLYDAKYNEVSGGDVYLRPEARGPPGLFV